MKTSTLYHDSFTKINVHIKYREMINIRKRQTGWCSDGLFMIRKLIQTFLHYKTNLTSNSWNTY